MTLKCNKVELWKCPEWVANMCLHKSNEVNYIGTGSGTYAIEKPIPTWALERYLMWAKSTLPGPRGLEKSMCTWEEHKMKVEEAMNSSELKVWME